MNNLVEEWRNRKREKT